MAYCPESGNKSGANNGEAQVNDQHENKKRPAVTPARAEVQDERKKRLAAELRENLRKRKSQQRAQSPRRSDGDAQE